eukprot:15186409-Alexandrium_andersonii.AAC.1
MLSVLPPFRPTLGWLIQCFARALRMARASGPVTPRILRCSLQRGSEKEGCWGIARGQLLA